jgi:DNA/RNA-binding domain of Phe-tRNA-synthetase-like protein
MTLSVTVHSHPLLDAGVFVARSVQPFVGIPTPPVGPPPFTPFPPGEDVKTAVRDLLRHGGFKPSGRSKPASEYLVAAHTEGRFPAINAGVDLCNLVSLHSGLPISLVDLDKVSGPLEIKIAPAGTTYVFNPSGQTIDVSGLVCLYDAEGPTGTPVKDAQRTKTHDGTVAALSIIWGTTALPERTRAAVEWYRSLVAQLPGTTVEDVRLI